MRVLIACERSGVLRRAFEQCGVEAYSCDLEPSDDASAYHYQCDATTILHSMPFDLVVAHPPCTYLSNVGARWWRRPGVKELQAAAEKFFMMFVTYACITNTPVVVENPRGCMSRRYRKADQEVHPYMFGDSFSKRTCLWLHNGVPLLQPTVVYGAVGDYASHTDDVFNMVGGANKEDLIQRVRRERSRSFVNMSDAMACQWSAWLRLRMTS